MTTFHIGIDNIMATITQKIWVQSLPDYPKMIKILGPYDPEKDYVGPGGQEATAISRVIPRTAYGIDLSPAAYVHDVDYKVGGDEADRFKADARFLVNMMKQIELVADKWYQYPWRHLARLRAVKYFEAVRGHGGSLFPPRSPEGILRVKAQRILN